MVSMNNLVQIYVDFLPITTTISDDDALALLLSMYTIFELSFPKNSRTIRLLYCIIHGEKRFLTNTIRSFVKDKKILLLDEFRSNRPNVSTSTSSEITIIMDPQESSSEKEKMDESNTILSRTTSSDDAANMINVCQDNRSSSTSLAITEDR